jgi:hypothetical protein
MDSNSSKLPNRLSIDVKQNSSFFESNHRRVFIQVWSVQVSVCLKNQVVYQLEKSVCIIHSHSKYLTLYRIILGCTLNTFIPWSVCWKKIVIGNWANSHTLFFTEWVNWMQKQKNHYDATEAINLTWTAIICSILTFVPNYLFMSKQSINIT